MATIEWNGAGIHARAALAAAAAVDRTMSECVRGARRDHEYVNRDGNLEATTDIVDAAHVDGDRVSGRWGSTADYALYVEIGTSRIGPTASEREDASDGMWTIPDPAPEPGVTVRQDFTILPPGTMEGQEDFVTLDRPSEGTGPLMEQRPFLRPQADRENPLLAPRMAAAFQGREMP